MCAQNIGRRRECGLAVPVGADCLDYFQLACHALPETVDPGAAGDVPSDAADRSDIATPGHQHRHLLASHLPSLDVVSADVYGWGRLRGLGGTGVDGAVDVDDRLLRR